MLFPSSARRPSYRHDRSRGVGACLHHRRSRLGRRMSLQHWIARRMASCCEIPRRVAVWCMRRWPAADPLTREIGEQLASGVVTPRALLSQPVYRDYFARALAAVECLDVHSIADCTAALAHTGHLTGDPKRDEVIAKAAQATSGLLGRRGETASYPHTRQ